jgi:ABC-type transport system substrate-binding protein
VPGVYEALYQYAYLADTYKVVPLLAADMPKISSDRLTVTIPLKHGIKYQDDPCFKETQGKGREMKAQDFVFAFKRLALPSLQSQGWWIFDGKVKGINAFHDKLAQTSKGDVPKVFGEDVEGIKAVDDYTIQLKLVKPYPQLLYVLAMGFASPVPPEAISMYADENGNLTDHPVGTGPFKLKSWIRGHEIVMERNPTYHPEFYPTEGSMDFRKKGLLADAGKPVPFIDKISIQIVKESQPSWLSFMKGETDLLELSKDNFNQAITNQTNLSPQLSAKGMRLTIDNGTVFYYVSFNMADKLVGTNRYLRQALSSAIDRDKWIEVFTNGTGRKMTSALPPGLQDRQANPVLKYDFNLNRAKDLLKKAGYPEGKGLPTLNFDLRGSDSTSRQMGEFFQQQWGAIGVKINVITNTFPAFLEKLKQSNLQISLGGWSIDYPDAENVFQILYGPNGAPGPNDSNYNNPEMNKLYEQLAVMEPGPKRAEVIKKMDDLVQEDVPWAYGFYQAIYEIAQPWLLNYRAGEIILTKFKYLRVNKDVKKRYMELK